MRAGGDGASGAPVATTPSPGPRRPPLPLHRLATDRRRRRTSCRTVARSARLRTDALGRRAPLEGGVAQRSGPRRRRSGGFADDTAPVDALVAVRRRGRRVAGRRDARRGARPAGKVQGRRSTAALTWPRRRAPPVTGTARCGRRGSSRPTSSRTPSWCVPGGEPVTPLGNGGAFGGKVASERRPPSPAAWPTQHGRPVRACCTPGRTSCARARSVRRSPPGCAPTARGVIRVARTPGVVAAVDARLRRTSTVEEVDVAGPPTSIALRAAGWAEAAVAAGVARAAPTGHRGHARRRRRLGDRRRRRRPRARPLRRPARRGRAAQLLHRRRAHGARLGAFEGIAVDADGVPVDLTIRSFGILRAADTPAITVDVDADDGPPVNGSDAVFAAVAAAAWRAAGHPPRWPAGLASRR